MDDLLQPALSWDSFVVRLFFLNTDKEKMARPECSVCLNIYTETGDRVPILLACSHTLCWTCVLKLAVETGGCPNPVVWSLKCPECRQPHRVVHRNHFLRNRYVTDLMRLHSTTEEKIRDLQNTEGQAQYQATMARLGEKKASAEAQQVRQEMAQAQQEAARARAEATTLTRNLQNMENQRDQAQEEATQAWAEAQQVRQEMAQAQQEAARARVAADQAKTKAARAKAGEDQAKAAENQAKAAVDQAKAKEDQAKAEAERAKAEADQAREKAQQVKQETIRALEAEAWALRCTDHDKPWVVFCSDASCRKMLCVSCPLVEHTDHVLSGLEEHLSSTKKGRKVCGEVNDARGKLSEYLKELQNAEDKAEETFVATCEEIERQLQAATERAQTLTKLARENLKEQLNEIENTKKKAEQAMKDGDTIKNCFETETVKKSYNMLLELGAQFSDYQKQLTEVKRSLPTTAALEFVPLPATDPPLGDLVPVPAPATQIPFPEVPEPEVPEVVLDLERESEDAERVNPEDVAPEKKPEVGADSEKSEAETKDKAKPEVLETEVKDEDQHEADPENEASPTEKPEEREPETGDRDEQEVSSDDNNDDDGMPRKKRQRRC